MKLRPAEARWFETYIPHEHTVEATEVLARTGVVQLDLDPRLPEAIDVGKLRQFVDSFRTLAEAHGEDMPSGSHQPTSLVGRPVQVANQALQKLRVWSAQLDYLKEHLADLQSERDYLLLLEEAIGAIRGLKLFEDL